MNRLYNVDQCESTNDSIAEFISANQSGITALYTLHQTKGRGQYGNNWLHTKDQNLAITFAVPADEILLADSLFNYYTAILVRDLIANMTNSAVQIKWPNDLIIGEKKVAGILLEKKKIKNQTFILIGIGINIKGQNLSAIPNSGTIYSQTKVDIDIDLFAQKLFDHLKTHLIEIPSADHILKVYNEHLFRKKQVSCFESNNNRQNGIIQQANADGTLSINLEQDGLQNFYLKQISLLY